MRAVAGETAAVLGAIAMVLAPVAGAQTQKQTQTGVNGVVAPPSTQTLAALNSTGFNGTIKFMTYPDRGNGKATPMTQYTSGQKVRYDMIDTTGQVQGAFIIDGTTGTTTLLMTQQKQYIQITPQQVQAAANQIKPTADSLVKQYKLDTMHAAPTVAAPAVTNSNPNVQVTKVGTDVVAGVPCDVYDVSGTDNSGKTESGEVCSAKGVGFFFMGAGAFTAMGPYGAAAMAKNPAAQQQYAVWQQVLGGGRGIVRIASLDNGQKHVNMVATSIDRSTPPDGVFEVPPGYTKLQMPSLKSVLAGNGNGSTAGSAANGVANSAAQGAQQTADSAANQGAKNAVKKLIHFP